MEITAPLSHLHSEITLVASRHSTIFSLWKGGNGEIPGLRESSTWDTPQVGRSLERGQCSVNGTHTDAQLRGDGFDGRTRFVHLSIALRSNATRRRRPRLDTRSLGVADPAVTRSRIISRSQLPRMLRISEA